MEHFCEYLIDGKYMFSRELEGMYSTKARLYDARAKLKQAEKDFADAAKSLDIEVWKHYNEDEIKAGKRALMNDLFPEEPYPENIIT